MKLREAVSWLTGTLQRQLFPRLEECWERRLTEKERQLVSILEVLQIEKFAGRPAQRFGRKPWERQAIARAFVGKAVYNQPTTRATVEALRASPNFRRICGFVRPGDIPSEATFSRAFGELCEAGTGGPYQPGCHGHPGPGKTAAQVAVLPAGAPETRPPPARGGANPETGDAAEAPVPASGRRGPDGAAGAL